MSTKGKDAVFDQPHAISLADAQWLVVRKLLERLMLENDIRRACDVGCGVGVFSQRLAALGIDVLGVDGREENVAEAGLRCPNCRFEVGDVQSSAVRKIGSFDLVFCFGLLYHLENPFAALRNLAAMTNNILFLSTRFVPGEKCSYVLYDEGAGRDQSLNYVAVIPSRPAFLRMLYEVGFANVYGVNELPRHEEFIGSQNLVPCRTLMVASRNELDHVWLKKENCPRGASKSLWDPSARSSFARHVCRKLVKK